MAMGIVYKNVFRLVKDDEFNKGVDNVALIAGLAQKHYFRAY